MKIKYSTVDNPLKAKAIFKILNIIKDGEYRFGINGSVQEMETWFLLNDLSSTFTETVFLGDNKEFQDLTYFYVFGKMPKKSTKRGREWASLLKKSVLKKSEKLGMPIHDPMSPWYETKITKHNLKEELDKLKAMYEN